MYEYEPMGNSPIRKFEFILVAFESPVEFDNNDGLTGGGRCERGK